MTDPRNQFDREEQAVHDAYSNGEITLKQYNREILELQRAYAAEAEEAAHNAYDDEMDRW